MLLTSFLSLQEYHFSHYILYWVRLPNQLKTLAPHLGPSQIPVVELFSKITNRSTLFTKRSIIDLWQRPK